MSDKKRISTESYKKRSQTLLFLVVTFAMFVIVLLYVSTNVVKQGYCREIGELKEEIEAISNENRNLNKEIAVISSPAFMAQKAVDLAMVDASLEDAVYGYGDVEAKAQENPKFEGEAKSAAKKKEETVDAKKANASLSERKDAEQEKTMLQTIIDSYISKNK